MNTASIAGLRAVLVAILFGTLAAQLLYFPVLADQLSQAEPDLAWLRWPLLSVVVFSILVAQVALGAVWALLSLVSRDAMFSPHAFKWVNLFIAATLLDSVIMLGVNGYLSFFVHANPPSLMLFLLALALGGFALALLMTVMKGLLRKASEQRAELDEVI